MRSNHSKSVALGGVLAAVAVVSMCLGGLIPIATYICPMICIMTQFLVLHFCGRRLSWAWFVVVAFLSLLLGPDKEAAMVFCAVGYYPIIKQSIEKYRISVVLKFVFFNSSVLCCYGLMIYLLGMQEIIEENAELGTIGLFFVLILGNLTFFLLDRLLAILDRKLR